MLTQCQQTEYVISGRLFQSQGASPVKARSPLDLNVDSGTAKRPKPADLRGLLGQSEFTDVLWRLVSDEQDFKIDSRRNW